MHRLFKWFADNPNRIVIAGLIVLVLLANWSVGRTHAANVPPLACVQLGSFVSENVLLREIDGSVEKHIALLRSVNPEVIDEIFEAIARFVRRGYAERTKSPEDIGNEFTADCFARGGHYPPPKSV